MQTVKESGSINMIIEQKTQQSQPSHAESIDIVTDCVIETPIASSLNIQLQVKQNKSVQVDCGASTQNIQTPFVSETNDNTQSVVGKTLALNNSDLGISSTAQQMTIIITGMKMVSHLSILSVKMVKELNYHQRKI